MAANVRVIRRCRMRKVLSIARGVCGVALESASCSLELCSLPNFLSPALKRPVYGSDAPPQSIGTGPYFIIRCSSVQDNTCFLPRKVV